MVPGALGDPTAKPAQPSAKAKRNGLALQLAPQRVDFARLRRDDPTLGRYTQPDPLGFVDGPSVYGYAGGSPLRYVDRDGRNAGTAIGGTIGGPAGAVIGGAAFFCAVYPDKCSKIIKYCLDPTKGGGDDPPKPSPPPPPRENKNICRKIPEVSIDGIICIYQYPNGSTRRFNSGTQACPNVIFTFEGGGSPPG